MINTNHSPYFIVLFYVSDVEIAVWFVLFLTFLITSYYIILSWMQFQGRCAVTAVMYVRWVEKQLKCDLSPFQCQVSKH